MSKWGSNEGYPRIQIFSTPKKQLHSSPFDHSTVIWKCSVWKGMKITMERSHSRFISVIPNRFVIQEWGWNDEMRLNVGIFLKKGKTLTFRMSLIPSPFRHSIGTSFSSYFHPIHLMVILSLLNHSILPFHYCHSRLQMTGMPSEWFNTVLSLLKRQHHIKPFRGHSGHSSTFWAHSGIIKYVLFRMNQKWPLNDLIWCCLFIYI